jgi:hypothetical protein
MMLLNCILILQKTPFPPRYATNWQQTYTLMQVWSQSYDREFQRRRCKIV